MTTELCAPADSCLTKYRALPSCWFFLEPLDCSSVGDGGLGSAVGLSELKELVCLLHESSILSTGPCVRRPALCALSVEISTPTLRMTVRKLRSDISLATRHSLGN